MVKIWGRQRAQLFWALVRLTDAGSISWHSAQEASCWVQRYSHFLPPQPKQVAVAGQGASHSCGVHHTAAGSMSFGSHVQKEEPKPLKGKARWGEAKYASGLRVRETLCCGSLCTFPSWFALPGHKGEQLRRSYRLSAPLSPAAAGGRKQASCQEASALEKAEDCTRRGSWMAPRSDGRGNQKAAHRALQSRGFNAFCPVIKKSHRLQLNTENMIHPVCRHRPLHPSRPKRAAEAEARRSLRGSVCGAPSAPGLSPFSTRRAGPCSC